MLRHTITYDVFRSETRRTGYGDAGVLTASRWHIGTVNGFLHETADTEVNNSQTVNGTRQRATFTMNTGEMELHRLDILVSPDGAQWRVTSTPNSEVNPFTGWQPTTTVTVERLQS